MLPAVNTSADPASSSGLAEEESAWQRVPDCRDFVTLSRVLLAGSTPVEKCAEEEAGCTVQVAEVDIHNWDVAEDGN